MNQINFIAKHLDRCNLKLPVVECNTVCSFTGDEIKEGVSNKDLIKSTFTDHEYIKHDSGFSSVNTALCIEAVIKTEKGFNSLRNYSYLVTDDSFKILQRENILSIIQTPPVKPFVLVVTFSNKKHTSYKSIVNYNRNTFVITTDIGNCEVKKECLDELLPIIEKWYSVIPEKATTKQLPTHFTKEEIKTGKVPNYKITAYGLDKFMAENEVIQKYRNTLFIDLIVHILNKQEIR